MRHVLVHVFVMMVVFVVGVFVSGCGGTRACSGGEAPAAGSTASAEQETQAVMDRQIATFAAGCFWGVESSFRQVEGVVATSVGYTGGATANPTYKEVCTGRTGHAEAVRVEFDPSKVSYEELLEVFWRCHDPTTLNRQGPDIGTQYRSAIFHHNAEQEGAAQASKRCVEESDRLKGPIVTEIASASAFYRAEEYHQQYLEKRGQAACGSGGA